MDIDLRVTEEAAERWQARQQEREPKRSKIEAGQIFEVESQERIKKRMDRLAEAAIKQNAVAWPPASLVQGLPVPGNRPCWSIRSAWSGCWGRPISWA